MRHITHLALVRCVLAVLGARYHDVCDDVRDLRQVRRRVVFRHLEALADRELGDAGRVGNPDGQIPGRKLFEYVPV
jgi:hypothetical protein